MKITDKQELLEAVKQDGIAIKFVGKKLVYELIDKIFNILKQIN
jgi:hypothetical protein